MKTIFFSHSLTTYNTIAESKCLGILERDYPEYYIINPAHQNLPDDFNQAMKCALPLLASCNILAYYKDNSYSPGVDMEIAEAKRLNIAIINLEDMI